MDFVNTHTAGMLTDAKTMADFLKSDNTVGGIFPKAHDRNLDEVNEALFKDKFCKHWSVIRPVLNTAKIFTPEKIDRIIDKLIEVGDTLCN
ncbi:MAG: hypothetical protein ACRC3B_05015 [Bacteroidia bacterium]